MSKTILIPGGAGYIGSHTAYLMTKLGYKVVIIDNFSQNQKFNPTWAQVIKADFADERILNKIFKKNKIDTVMHFAALIEVGESVKYPQKFWNNNVIKTKILLDIMLKYEIKNIVFSSSCAVYGNPTKLPLNEKNPYNPISPYGKNKLAVEFILQDYAAAYNLKYVALRYFNAAGASPEQDLGEQHSPETHIIPLILRAIKHNNTFKIFGTDYNTKDGTCVRDYIHVKDIANAHALALKYLEEGGKSDYFNLGSQTGYSVKQMIEKAQEICNKKINLEYLDRRSGDADILIADSRKIQKNLNWQPKFSNLDYILKTAWQWEQR